MNKKKNAIACVIILFIFLSLGVVYIFTELYTESEIPVVKVNESGKFKEEYESVNNKELENGKIVRELSIPTNNPFKYKTAKDIVDAINEKQTFVVYFGFSECPWCRSVIGSMIESAKNNDIKSIYYVDVKDIRDKYELDQNNKAVRVVDGSEDYYQLLYLLDGVLDNYSPLTYKNKKKKTVKVEINEKRIYAPSVVLVKNGVPIALETGIPEDLTDPYMELTNELKCDSKQKFNCLFEKMNEDNETCSLTDKMC